LFDANEFQLAALAYERSIFQDEFPSLKNEILLRKTHCLKALKRYEDGYKNLLRADLYTDSDSLNFAMRYELVLNAYLSEHYDIAENHLKQLNHFVTSEELKQKVAFLEILTLNEQMKWKEARGKLESFSDDRNLDFNIDSLYYFTDKPKIRDLKKTASIATFGSGILQIREGKPIDGLLSMSIRAGLLYLAVDQFRKHYFFSGSFSAVGVYFLFYQGAVKYALELTKKGNKRKIAKYNYRIKHALLAYEMSIINDNFNNNH